MRNLFNNTYRIPSARHPKWDYSSNAYYFITICTRNKISYFGKIHNRKIVLSRLGRMAEKLWQSIPEHLPFVDIDQFAIMPNHIHGIIAINKDSDHDLGRDVALLRLYKKHNQHMSEISPMKGSLASVIRSYKSICTRELHKLNPTFSWQTRYYDKIIRNERHLLAIRKYIYDNPANWRQDKYFG